MKLLHEFDGHEYGLGCQPRLSRVGDHPVWGADPDLSPMIPRSQWPELIALGIGNLSAGVRAILNQTNRPDCWAFASTQCLMVGRELDGHSFAILAPDVCPVLTNQYNGGAINSALLQVLLPIGLPPATILPGCDPVAGRHNLNPRTWPADWKELAAKYRAARGKFYDCPTFDHVGSALLSGWPVVMGVDWQGGGHALCRST